VEFVILFALALAFWWMAGRLIDDVLDTADSAWTRAHEDIGRGDE
jgi:hypothetical protein